MRRPSGTWLIPSATISCGGPRCGWVVPSKRIVPAAGCSMPEIVRSVVVLPAPLAPSSATISPSATSRLTPLQGADRPVADLDPVELEQRHQRSSSSGSGLCRRPARRRPLRWCSAWRRRAGPGTPRRRRGRAGPRPGCPPRSQAEIEHGHTLGHRHHEPHVVLDEQDADAPLPVDAADELARAPASRPGWCRPPARRAAAARGGCRARGRSRAGAGRRRGASSRARSARSVRPTKLEELLGASASPLALLAPGPRQAEHRSRSGRCAGGTRRRS